MESMYPRCGICGNGFLLPVNMGKEGDRGIKYRCTNPECNVRFDEHGYERYDAEEHEWQRSRK